MLLENVPFDDDAITKVLDLLAGGLGGRVLDGHGDLLWVGLGFIMCHEKHAICSKKERPC